MFCKKCGKEITGQEKFCPACGEKVDIRTAEPASKGDDKQQKKSCTGKSGKGNKKRFGVIIAGIITVIIAGVIAIKLPGEIQDTSEKISKNISKDVSQKASKGSSQGDSKSKTKGEAKDKAEDDTYGFDKDFYKDLPFSKKQVKELEKIYNESYKDEKENLNNYIKSYMIKYNEYGGVKEGFDELVGCTEDLYQAVNTFAPNLKDVLAKDAGVRYGDSVLEMHLIEKGVGIVLADNELGRDIRAFMERVVLDGTEYLTIEQMKEDKKEILKSDSMVPVASSKEYALVRSYGNIGSMLYQLEIISTYNVVNAAIEERLAALTQQFAEIPLEEHWSEDIEVVFNSWKKDESIRGREAVLKQEKEKWDKQIYKDKSELLKKAGIKDVDVLLQAMIPTSENMDSNAMQEAEKILGKYVYSIIDKEGKVHSSFLVANDGLEAVINDKGMCSVSNGRMPSDGDFEEYSERFPHAIMTKEGKILFENDMTEGDKGSIYYDVTPSGNVLKKTFDSDLKRGDYQTLEFVQQDGTTKKLLEGGFVVLEQQDYRDYYSYSCGYRDDSEPNTSGFIDMTTGKLITDEEYNEVVKTKVPDVVDETLKGFVDYVEPKLNENYRLIDDTLYDDAGNAVKELSEGRGVAEIAYNNEKYWVVTNTGWYYVLDKDFKEILKPVELPKDVTYILTGYGVLTVEASETQSYYRNQYDTYLYDEKGKKTKLLEKKDGDVKADDFLVWTAGGFAATPTNGGVNLNTKEPLFISMPEEPISLIL